MHELEPLVDEKVPMAHEVHAEAPATEYVPAVQVPVGEVRPVVAQYDPAVH